MLLTEHTGAGTFVIGWEISQYRHAPKDIEAVLEASKYPIGSVLEAELKAGPSDERMKNNNNNTMMRSMTKEHSLYPRNSVRPIRILMVDNVADR